MTTMEKYARTMELLHDVKVAPFNPNYDEKKAHLAELQASFMHALRKELIKLDDNDINGASGICNKIEDMAYIFTSAILENNGYYIGGENNTIHHKTERGEQLITKTFN